MNGINKVNTAIKAAFESLKEQYGYLMDTQCGEYFIQIIHDAIDDFASGLSKSINEILYNKENGIIKTFADKELIFLSTLRKGNGGLAKEPELRELIDSILADVQKHILHSYKELCEGENSND